MIAMQITTSCRDRLRKLSLNLKSRHGSRHHVAIRKHLAQTGMLESTGGRGAVYHLPGETIPTPDDVFGPPARISVAGSPDLEVSPRKVSASSPDLKMSSPDLAASSPDLEERRDANGCLMTDLLARPIIDDLGRYRQTYARTWKR